LSDGREIVAKAIVVATGARYKRLDVPSLERFVGRSIFYTTLGETQLAHHLDVAVAGGGNSAGQAAVHLARFARQVTLVVRATSLDKGMSDYLVQQIHSTPNIDVRVDSEIVNGDGRDRLETLLIENKKRNVVKTIPATLLFVLIGATPHTDWLAGVVQRDAKGFILTGHDVDLGSWPMQRKPMTFETSVPGLFSIGDVRLGSTKRVASAVGEGAGAVADIHRYMNEADKSIADTRGHFPGSIAA
jgi:thioredoxin reductase (NADPH)